MPKDVAAPQTRVRDPFATIKAAWRRFWGYGAPPAPAPTPATKRPGLRVRKGAATRAAAVVETDNAAGRFPGAALSFDWRERFPVAPVPPWVADKAPTLQVTMDDANGAFWDFAGSDVYADWETWPGFPALAELTQRPEYRLISETRAKEMTRKWGKLTYTGEDDSDATKEKLKRLKELIDLHHLRDKFRTMAEHDGYYGGGHLFVETNQTGPTALTRPMTIERETFAKGMLKGFNVIEPMWVYPNRYNSTDPLRDDYFKPQQWYVMGRLVHATRLITMISAPVPDILKPAYAFRGISLSQRSVPYINAFLGNRRSSNAMLKAYSIVILHTILQDQLQDGDDWDDVYERVTEFNQTRDNRNAFVIDKETEDVTNVAAPLAGVRDLLQASVEQMAFVPQMPLVKFLGVTPSGLNASSDGEIRVFYDMIKGQQEDIYDDPMLRALKLLQLNEWGEVDPDIGWEWESLWELDEAGRALVQKTQADIDAIYIEAQVISQEEVRERLTKDETSQYFGLSLDPDELPEPPDLGEGEGGEGGPKNTAGDPAKQAESRKEERSGVGGDAAPFDMARFRAAFDAAWNEADHPRDPIGRFGSGGGGGSGSGAGAGEGSGSAETVAEFFSKEETAHLPSTAAVRQPASTWRELEHLGAQGREQFAKALGTVAKKLDLKTDVPALEALTPEHADTPEGYLFVAPNKSEKRAAEKVRHDYGGDWSMLKDMVRASIAVSSIDELRKAVEAVKASGLKLAAKPKDKFSAPTEEGYRDLNTLVELPNGMVAELQFHVKSMLLAKTVGHAHYEGQQEVERRNGAAPTEEWSKEDREAFLNHRAAQKALYGYAWSQANVRRAA
jgi:uncharacterized protein